MNKQDIEKVINEQIGCGYCIKGRTYAKPESSCELFNQYDKETRHVRGRKREGGTRDLAMKCGIFVHFAKCKKTRF